MTIGIRVDIVTDSAPEELSFTLAYSGVAYNSTGVIVVDDDDTPAWTPLIDYFSTVHKQDRNNEGGPAANSPTNQTQTNEQAGSTPVTIGRVAPGQLPYGNTTFTYTGANILSNGSYLFTLEDNHGDGWCCSNGTGRVDIYKVQVPEDDPDTTNPGESTLLYTFSGPFNFSHEGNFVLA